MSNVASPVVAASTPSRPSLPTAATSRSSKVMPTSPNGVVWSVSTNSAAPWRADQTPTAGVVTSPASSSMRESPPWTSRRGMSEMIGGTLGPMSAGSVSRGGYAMWRDSKRLPS